MLRLSSCNFEGLKGFEKLELTDLKRVTTLIGPNGSGKSTTLRAIRLAFEILKKRTCCDELPDHEDWYRFSKATLSFTYDEPAFGKLVTDIFSGEEGPITVVITCDEKTSLIESLTVRGVSMSSPQSIPTKTNLSKVESEISQIEDEIKKNQASIQQNQQAQHMISQVQAWRANATTLQSNLESAKSRFNEFNKLEFEFSDLRPSRELTREQADLLLGEIGFPMFRYIGTDANHNDRIQGLVDHLFVQKSSQRKEFDKYLDAIEKLKHVLQAQVDVYQRHGKNFLTVNDIEYRKASAGTLVALSFYGVTRLDESNCVVLWDEPENGLHPTRRHRLLELMFEDSRQFIVASHAPEFAPVFNNDGRVFRCTSAFDDANVKLYAERIANRRDAFDALEILGVHPARTLFTANVVIWVEGPTELLFYRHWLTPRLSSHNLHEGFHYTYMQYGGALINYLSVADHDQFESTFDLLSVCRHPIVLVDWDRDSGPGATPIRELLKTGAQKMHDGIASMNKDRAEAGCFLITQGREVENYLPNASIKHAMISVWKSSKDHHQKLGSTDFDVGQYESFDEVLDEYLVSQSITSADGKSLGKSLWTNKVAIMQSALEFPGLKEEDLRWKCVEHLREIEQFVLKKSRP
ncbi:hypothetical protein EKH79_04775 [Dyella dinghuensis]|uniref:AAA+ ATPase domain-containing protein n=1 Tax=Dyella dinghuensis TaxID=1920169 RepID=A0A3S0PHT6_9GAMM|nr:ATP-binding protein [Dyella dinghuensis]RUL66013.1 hypothetical protein EKH79_04775 [Dyella dinghuensis]